MGKKKIVVLGMVGLLVVLAVAIYLNQRSETDPFAQAAEMMLPMLLWLMCAIIGAGPPKRLRMPFRRKSILSSSCSMNLNYFQNSI